MKNNTVDVEGVEVYLNNIYALADEFVEKELDGKQEEVHDNFMRMIFYIRNRIEKPNSDDIEFLDKIFETFLDLCVRYHTLPTLECFSLLVKINRATFGDWRRKEYRASTAHSTTVQNWIDTCKSFTIERLHNSGKTDVNLIFTAKAAYGMVETAPMQIANTDAIPQLSREEIKARYQAIDDFKGEPERLTLE